MSSISEDDDSCPSLKELVTKNLEANGILGKLQAQLRASIFLILEEEYQEKNIPLTNEKTHRLLSSPVGKIAVAIIQDFLQCLNLDFSLTVFCPETKSTLTENSVNKQFLYDELGNSVNNEKENCPVLFQLIEKIGAKSKKIESSGTFPKGQTESNVSTKAVEDRSLITNVHKEDALTKSKLHPSDNEPKPIQNDDKEHQTSKSRLQQEENNFNGKDDYSENKSSSRSNTGSSGTTRTSKSSAETSKEPETSKEASESENSGSSTLSNNSSSESDKNTLSAIEKEYEDEFSSVSDGKNDQNESKHSERTKSSEHKKLDDAKGLKKEDKPVTDEEKSEIEEAVETAEDIDEDISLDDLLSSNSAISNQTKDLTVSKEHSVDYEESL